MAMEDLNLVAKQVFDLRLLPKEQRKGLEFEALSNAILQVIHELTVMDERLQEATKAIDTKRKNQTKP